MPQWLISLGISLVISAVLCLILVLTGRLKVLTGYDYSSANKIPMSDVGGEIYGDTVVEETVEFTEDELTCLSMRAATYTLQKVGKLDILLTDEDENDAVLGKWQVDTGTIADNSFFTVVPDKPIKDIKGHTLTITISSEEEKNNAITLWTSKKAGYSGQLMVSGKPRNDQLILAFSDQVSTAAPIVYAFAFLWIIFFGIVSLLFWSKEKRGKTASRTQKLGSWMATNKRLLLFIFGANLLLVFLFLLSNRFLMPLIGAGTEGGPNQYDQAFWFAAAAAVVNGIWLYRYAKEKPELVAAVFLLIAGGAYAYILPSMVMVNWDEAIHFRRAYGAAHLFDGTMPNYILTFCFANGIPRSDITEIAVLQNSQSLQNAYFAASFPIAVPPGLVNKIWLISYFPSAVMIRLAELLRLPFKWIYTVGGFGSLLFYVFLVYHAIKRVPSGKMILASIAFLGCSIFMSVRYNYDVWITGFYILGWSYFFSVLLEKKAASFKDLFIIWLSFLLGSMPKSIYFPLLVPLLFLPPGRFESQNQKHLYRAGILSSMVMLAGDLVLSFPVTLLMFAVSFPVFFVLSLGLTKLYYKSRKGFILLASAFLAIAIAGGWYFAANVLPFMLGAGDARGGAVGPSAQLIGVLQSPGKFIHILYSYLVNVLLSATNLAGWNQNFCSFAYLGSAQLVLIPEVLLIVVIMTDHKAELLNKSYKVLRILVLIFVFLTICLIGLGFYLSFTPVGENTINGYQPRYLIPMYPMVFTMLGSPKIRNTFNRRHYNMVVLGMLEFILFALLHLLVLPLYV